MKSSDFFHETTLRICGSLHVGTAVADLFAYFKQVFPIVGISLSIRD